MKLLTISGLSKSFAGTKILNRLRLEIDAGERVCVLGPSGSGKTTLLKILLGIEVPDAGDIVIDGSAQTEWLKQKRMAYVGQKYPNFLHLTVFENLSICPRSNPTKIQELLTEVGLWSYRDYYPSKLSGGMQQRLALARALLQETPIIAFDEPLGSLDPVTRTKMQKLILKELDSTGKSMVFVTHDIDEALFLGNTILVLHKGRPGFQKVYKPDLERESGFPSEGSSRYQAVKAALLKDMHTPSDSEKQV